MKHQVCYGYPVHQSRFIADNRSDLFQTGIDVLWLKDPEVRIEYEALKAEFQLVTKKGATFKPFGNNFFGCPEPTADILQI